MSDEPFDPVMTALRQLPPRATDPSTDARLQRQARAAYVRNFEGSSSWSSSAASVLGRVALPVCLGGVIGLYMTWAIATATALVR